MHWILVDHFHNLNATSRRQHQQNWVNIPSFSGCTLGLAPCATEMHQDRWYEAVVLTATTQEVCGCGRYPSLSHCYIFLAWASVTWCRRMVIARHFASLPQAHPGIIWHRNDGYPRGHSMVGVRGRCFHFSITGRSAPINQKLHSMSPPPPSTTKFWIWNKSSKTHCLTTFPKHPYR